MAPGGDTTRVLIAGGGPAGLEAMIALRHLAGERVALTLLAPDPLFAYRPLAVAEPFGEGAVRRYELEAIAAEHQATLVAGALDRVDAGAHTAHLSDGRELEWDVLLVAVGGRPQAAFQGALTVLDRNYVADYRGLLDELDSGAVGRVAFAVPAGVTWALPLYELALMTARRVAQSGHGAELHLVTPEAAPLEVFGRRASAELETMLAEAGVQLHLGAYPAEMAGGELRLLPGEGKALAADRVVALPVSTGPGIEGLPSDQQGFIPVDPHGLVEGEADVYAAGDATTFPLKQGGIATQEADAAAESIAARAGAAVEPRPFRPVLRGMLLTGGVPRYMRAEVAGGRGEEWEVAEHALWWPPSKIAGRYLSPYLGLHHHEVERGDEGEGGLHVEMDLAESGPGFVRRAVIAPQRGKDEPPAIRSFER
jgi:sulfide:quinone oxidoreductase